MVRTVDEAAHALRRDEFLDVAQRLLETRGYEQLSIQDVLTELGASKGAFYHYFGSKQALLEGVVERLADRTAAAVTPAADSGVPALDRLQGFFAALAGWKLERRDLLVALLRVWCGDDNAVLRQKLRVGIAERVVPLLAGILAQGAAEGVFDVRYPEASARVVVSLVQDLNDRLADLFLAIETGEGNGEGGLDAVEESLAAYTHAVERVLGLASGSVTLVEPRALRAWFAAPAPSKGAST